MKKSLLFLSALAISAFSASAGYEFESLGAQVAPQSAMAKAGDASTDGMDFRYYKEGEIDGLTYKSLYTGTVWVAAEMTPEITAAYADNNITSLNLITPPSSSSSSNMNYMTSVTVFLTHELGGTPFYTQPAKLPTSTATYTSIALETPYQIQSGETVYYGYYFSLTRNIASKLSYIAIDNVPAATAAGSLVCVNDEWSTVQDYGSLLIGVTIKGDNLPVDMASVGAIHAPLYAENQVDFNFDVEILNQASNALTSATVEYKFGNGTSKTTDVTFDPIGYNESARVTLDYTCQQIGANIPLTAKVLKVNGNDNLYYGDISGETTLSAVANGCVWPRNVLLEEATGTWCGYCPAGLLAFDYVRKTYTDGSMIPVAVHGGDEMTISSYSGFLSYYISGYPQYMVNRDMALGAQGLYGNQAYNNSLLDAIHDYYTSQAALGRVSLHLEWTDETKSSVHATTCSTFAMPLQGNYRVAFIVVEDGVGPYKQSNNYSSTQGMGAFTGGGSSVSWTYDDVARNIFSVWGLSNSNISNPKLGEVYDFSYDVSLVGVRNIEKARVVAALLDTESREVVNCMEMALSEATSADNLLGDAEAVSIRTQLGAVVVNGAATTEVYTIDGRRAATAYGEAVINLPTGLYIVKADNIVKKVIVK